MELAAQAAAATPFSSLPLSTDMIEMARQIAQATDQETDQDTDEMTQAAAGNTVLERTWVWLRQATQPLAKRSAG
jgi:hypothetical protein